MRREEGAGENSNLPIRLAEIARRYFDSLFRRHVEFQRLGGKKEASWARSLRFQRRALPEGGERQREWLCSTCAAARVDVTLRGGRPAEEEKQR